MEQEQKAEDVTAASEAEVLGGSQPGSPPVNADIVDEERAAGLVQEDLAELRQRAQERDEYLTLAQRTQADFENYRRRMARDLAAAEERGIAKLLETILPAVDSLERALATTAELEHESENHLVEGLRLVHAEFSAAFQRAGVQAYDPTGETFDPTAHEAMAQQPIAGVEPGKIAEVFQRGYRLNETVIRPARVVVGAPQPEKQTDLQGDAA